MTDLENETPDERALRRLKSYVHELPMPQKAAAARIIQNAGKGRFTAVGKRRRRRSLPGM